MKIHSLPLSWYDRPQYRPVLPTPDAESWFPLAREELTLRSLSEEDCRKRAADGVPDREGLVAAFKSTCEDWRLPETPEATAAL